MQNQQRQVVEDLPGRRIFEFETEKIDNTVQVLPDAVNQMSINQQQPNRPRMPPKPRPAPKPKSSPKARVLYDYQAGDNDEITLAEGEQVEVRAFIRSVQKTNLNSDTERGPKWLVYGA